MSQLFHPELINEPFGDPGLYVDLLHQDHALLFDMGDITGLPSRKLSRIAHAFVSHAHMDHFYGFDLLLRSLLGQPKRLSISGPEGFIAHVENRLGGYCWNLGDEDSVDTVIQASEYSEDGRMNSARFRFRNGFGREDLAPSIVVDGVILDTPGYTVRAAQLCHHIPCLGFAIEEKQHLNVWRTRVIEMQLGVGPWLGDLKQAILAGAPDDTLINACWSENGRQRAAVHPLKALRHLVEVTPGQKIAYVTDIGYTPDNVEKTVWLAGNADALFIESPFLEADANLALRKMHLTARQAGEIARRANVRRFEQFHFSPRYHGQKDRLYAEAANSAGLPVADIAAGSVNPVV